MKIFPAIDLYNGCAVRLLKGDYNQMTIYSENPGEFAAAFEQKGAENLHLVDLEGAKSGATPNLNTIKNIVSQTNLYTELGGGIRSLSTIDKYLNIGVNRLILGTAAITEQGFVEAAIKEFGQDSIAVGIDIKEEKVAIKGWTEVTDITCDEFCKQMESIGVKTIICTDISKDGAMKGTNRQLYKSLSEKFGLDIMASGGVSTLDDIKALSDMNLYGAILGKALYTGAIDLKDAIKTAKGV
ncbi:MAG: 1-(5-phosphoribosyl)-5-[(5-phosphoribosylamino)methylideneamino]imidazole-4-carboxamide isomerase [Firmicutes bacterium]|jgi:phosphoribosylformimino-5-aminoimidazole carboxamide ribotide isomerase|nr:1-(5-phosphoribosyl)-5-[(5-phosphoribosylamino)methylideneamino]imidazole-4-carboxamide isomerase [Bacillota bacterium]